MIRVGILSMQRIANYGSLLQAYGLRQILEELGCDVEFVDYHPGKTLLPVDGGTGIARIFSKVWDVFRCSAPLKEKIRYVLYKKNYSSKYYPYLGIDGVRNYAPELDLLVIGSDEVFNCVQNNANVGFSPELFGEGSHTKRLISYAASFGNTTIGKLEQYGVKEQVAKWLNRFDAISVRDANSGAVIKALTEIMPEFHLDPVLAYDFVGMCSKIPREIPESNYMILYGYSGRFTKEECAAIRTYAKNRCLSVFCIGGVQNCCDRLIDCDPFQVIAYFQHAECVVTDTFHGTILSVITHQNFVSVLRSSGYGNTEKLSDLLDRLHLNDRAINDMKRLEKMLKLPIDYRRTDNVIENEREHTRRYLTAQLSEFSYGAQ